MIVVLKWLSGLELTSLASIFQCAVLHTLSVIRWHLLGDKAGIQQWGLSESQHDCGLLEPFLNFRQLLFIALVQCVAILNSFIFLWCHFYFVSQQMEKYKLFSSTCKSCSLVTVSLKK